MDERSWRKQPNALLVRLPKSWGRHNLDLARKKLYVVEEKLEVMKWHHEVLYQQYSKLGQELDRTKLKERHLTVKTRRKKGMQMIEQPA